MVTDFAAVGDGDGASATANRNALISALSNSSDTVFVPAGTYVVDNSTLVVINNFSGVLDFDPNAKILFNSLAAGDANTHGGLMFAGGSGAVINNIHLAFTIPPGTLRDSTFAGALKFNQTANTTLNGALVEGSLSSGIMFYDCTNPIAENVYVLNTLADGFDFFNDQNAEINNLYTNNTGDDGLAFVRYLNGNSFDSYSGGTSTNIVVKNSYARGIALIGATNVNVDNFYIATTTGPGAMFAWDSGYNVGIPDNGSFAHGTILFGGNNGPQPPSVQNATPTPPSHYGFLASVSSSSPQSLASRLSLNNMIVSNANNRSVSVN
ncbi:MAG TPA: hypothetical protein VHA30_05235, partial [Patescibacteria group bacterium]|nr:hypothetical protein [Patescibacteria group bacterium]